MSYSIIYLNIQVYCQNVAVTFRVDFMEIYKFYAMFQVNHAKCCIRLSNSNTAFFINSIQ